MIYNHIKSHYNNYLSINDIYLKLSKYIFKKYYKSIQNIVYLSYNNYDILYIKSINQYYRKFIVLKIKKIFFHLKIKYKQNTILVGAINVC